MSTPAARDSRATATYLPVKVLLGLEPAVRFTLHLKWECQTVRTQQEAYKFGGGRPAQEIDAIIAYGYTTVF